MSPRDSSANLIMATLLENMAPPSPLKTLTTTTRRVTRCTLLAVALLLVSLPHLTLAAAGVDVQSHSDTHRGHQHVSKRQISLQRFAVEPDNITVNIGESVVLPCKISNKAGIVQWTRDGFGLGTDPRLEGFPTYTMMHNEEMGDYSLKISSVTLEDDATFQCQAGASDRVPGIRSQSARLTVQVAPDRPVIVLADFINAPTALQDRQVLSTTAGTKIELTCEAHGGRPAAKLAWLNGRNRVVSKGVHTTVTAMKDGKRYNTALRWTFEPTKADHNKRVTCRSSHGVGGNHAATTNYSMASITLEVKYAPEVKLEVTRLPAGGNAAAAAVSTRNMLVLLAGGNGGNLHGRVGDTLRFRCTADGNPGKEALLYEWYRGDEPIVGDDLREELILHDVDKSHNNAEIVCKVSNKIGTGRASIRLNIAYGPSFSPSMDYVYGVAAGDNVRLNCPVDSNPVADITWIKIGSSSVMTSGQKLHLKNVNADTTGQYLCRASVKGFPEISAIVYLRIYGPPKIRKRKTHNYAIVGERGHVECLVESVPSPLAITWIHNDKTLTATAATTGGGNTPSHYAISEETVPEEAVIIRASFDIVHTMQNDYGRYNCVVVNKYGSDWHVITLDEQTSFIAIATITTISISILVLIVLTTIICLLSIKHRKLVAEQQQQQHQQPKDEKHDMKKKSLKPSYASSDESSSDNQNIYSTTASTRTNSSSSDKVAVAETGTIITRSGSAGSPRSSASSFPPYSHGSGGGGSPTGLSSGHQQQQHAHHHNHHNHHNQHHHHHLHPLSMHHPQMSSSPFVEAMGMPSSLSSPFFNTLDMNVTTPDLMNNYHPANLSSRRLSLAESIEPMSSSYVSIVPQMPPTSPSYSLMPMYHFKDRSNLMELPSGESIYKASPYSVVGNTGLALPPPPITSFRSTNLANMPTPLPSLAKELDECLNKATGNSMATHV